MLKFGTSGVRGLVTEMTDLECYLYTKAYCEYLKKSNDSNTVCIAGDFRSSSPRILKAVVFAIKKAGLKVDNVGFAPTPMLALHSMKKKVGAIMVTGSHIPDDRNGIKFYMPDGEILKEDEQAISSLYVCLKEQAVPKSFDNDGVLNVEVELGEVNEKARQGYISRYTDFFPANCLAGKRIVCYQHSTVGRTIMPEILEMLGADVQLVGWSDSFVPIDTEAVANPKELAMWVKDHAALVSADGDCDRPLLVDEKGEIIRGDILGIIAAKFINADSISTPVSCNSAVELCGYFEEVSRTKIGSPYVIASMNEAVAHGRSRVIGYEANGGFLTGSDISLDRCEGVLTALPTRDAVLPILCALCSGEKLSELREDLPPRFTVGGIIRQFPTEKGQAIVKALSDGGIDYINEKFHSTFGKCKKLDLTDGVRMTFADGGIVHFRPSGNAPEFRVYTEYSAQEDAIKNNELGIDLVKTI